MRHRDGHGIPVLDVRRPHLFTKAPGSYPKPRFVLPTATKIFLEAYKIIQSDN